MSTEKQHKDALPLGYQLEEYEIEGVLGAGGFGVTYRARDVRLNRLVAIKEYLPLSLAARFDDFSVQVRTGSDVDEYEWGMRRFLDEAQTLAQFRHPSIVSVVRFFEAHGTAYIVMEYEDGEELGRLLERMPSAPDEGLLVGKLLMPLLDGLERVHDKDILHRDIKPSNIYIRKDDSPVLIDFGSARQDIGQKSQNLTSVVSGGYSPLEQYGSRARQGPWTDIYALGATLYRAVTGERPPDSTDRIHDDPYVSAVDAARGAYSDSLLQAIDAAMNMSVNDRPQSVAEFRALITGARTAIVDDHADTTQFGGNDDDATMVAGAGVGGARAGGRSGKAAGDAKKKSPALVVGGIVVALVVAGGIGYALLDSSDTSTQTEAAKPKPEPADVVKKTQPDVQPVVARPMPEPKPSENDIIQGLSMDTESQQHRTANIDGALMAYIQEKTALTDCIAKRCADLGKIRRRLQAAETIQWKWGGYSGTVEIIAANRTTMSNCAWRIQVAENIRSSSGARKQSRVYCTPNGFNRSVDTAEEVLTSP